MPNVDLEGLDHYYAGLIQRRRMSLRPAIGHVLLHESALRAPESLDDTTAFPCLGVEQIHMAVRQSGWFSEMILRYVTWDSVAYVLGQTHLRKQFNEYGLKICPADRRDRAHVWENGARVIPANVSPRLRLDTPSDGTVLAINIINEESRRSGKRGDTTLLVAVDGLRVNGSQALRASFARDPGVLEVQDSADSLRDALTDGTEQEEEDE